MRAAAGRWARMHGPRRRPGRLLVEPRLWRRLLTRLLSLYRAPRRPFPGYSLSNPAQWANTPWWDSQVIMGFEWCGQVFLGGGRGGGGGRHARALHL